MQMKEKIEAIIEKALERQERQRYIGIYYASELPFCERANYFKYTKPKKFSTETLMLFESGSLVHDWFARIFRESDLIGEHSSEGSAIYREPEFQIRGRFDNLFVLTMNGEKVLLEVKTVMNKRFIKSPKTHHISQLNFYMNMIGYKLGYLLYVDRRDLSFKIFPINASEKLFKEIIERARKLHQNLNLEIMPDAEATLYTKMKWMCRYCSYKEECTFHEKVKEPFKDQM